MNSIKNITLNAKILYQSTTEEKSKIFIKEKEKIESKKWYHPFIKRNKIPYKRFI